MLLKDRVKATRVASITGQIFAVLFFTYGIYADHFVLIFIGLFVFIMARNEYRQILLEEIFRKTLIGDFYRKEYTRIYPHDSMRKVINVIDEGSFLVFNEEDVIIGALPSLFVKDALKRNALSDSVMKYVSPSFGYLNTNLSLNTAFDAINKYGWSIAAVLDENQNLVGVLDRKRINEFLRKRM